MCGTIQGVASAAVDLEQLRLEDFVLMGRMQYVLRKLWWPLCRGRALCAACRTRATSQRPSKRPSDSDVHVPSYIPQSCLRSLNPKSSTAARPKSREGVYKRPRLCPSAGLWNGLEVSAQSPRPGGKGGFRK